MLNRPDVQLVLPIEDPGHVGRVRRAAQRLADEVGFLGARQEEIGIAAQEAASNVAVHAGHGTVLLRGNPGMGVEMLALDSGPGITNLSEAMTDGFSTAGTAGVGLGAIERLSSRFSIFSRADRGVVLWALFAPRPPAIPPLGSVCVPFPGQTACGDGWAWDPALARLVVSDGLGHGPKAQEATLVALDAIRGSANANPKTLIMSLHRALSRTRGAAVAVATLDRTTSELHFAGIGNIAATVIGPSGRRSLLSNAGVVGDSRYKARNDSLPMEAHDRLIMHSDGLKTRWTVDDLQGVLHQPAPIIAGLLYRDFTRGRDDSTIVVASGETMGLTL